MRSVWEERDCEKSSLFLTGSLARFPLPVVPVGGCDLGGFPRQLTQLLVCLSDWKRTNVKAEFLSRFNLVWLDEHMTEAARWVWPERASKVKLQADRTIAGSRLTINRCCTPGFTALLTGSSAVDVSLPDFSTQLGDFNQQHSSHHQFLPKFQAWRPPSLSDFAIKLFYQACEENFESKENVRLLLFAQIAVCVYSPQTANVPTL